MKKIWIALVIFCLMMGSISAYAENFEWTDDIAYGETKTITIPRPDGDVDEGYVYFTQFFTFTPKAEGTYRFLVSYEEDESAPYDIFMDVGCDDGYWELENGCEFEAEVGKSYELMFQYNSDDGRYPEFTFYLESDDVEIPKTDDMALLLPAGMMLLTAMLAVCLFSGRKKMQ